MSLNTKTQKPKTSIEAIFLDIGGVVLEIDWRPVLKNLDIHDQVTQQRLVNEFHSFEPHHQFERGQINEDEFLTQLSLFFGYHEDQEKIIHAWNSLVLGPINGIERIFEKYSGKIPIYTLSNTNRIHMKDCFERFSVMSLFDDYCMSYDLGHRKPENEIYLAAISKAGLDSKPGSCLFIDDTLDNVEAARKAGLKAEHSINSSDQTLDHLEKHIGY